jgi:putative transposase
MKALMRRRGIEAFYRQPRTTRPEPDHKIYPYLPGDLEITRRNQVWATDITYIPRAHGSISPPCWIGRHVVRYPGGR